MLNSQEWRKERQFYYTTAASLAALYSWFQVAKLQLEILKKSHERRKIIRTPIVPISEIIDDKSMLTSDTSKMIFLEGVPTGVNKFTYSNEDSKNIPILFKVDFNQPLYSNSSFNDTSSLFDPKAIYNDVQYKYEKLNYFSLSDPQTSSKSVKVNFSQDCDISTAIQFIKSTEKKRRLTFAEHIGNIASIFYGVAVRTLGFFSIFSFLSHDFSFKGIHIGYKNSEFGIKATGLLSVLGHVIYDSKENKFRVESPKYITLSKNDLIANFNKNIEKLQNSRNIQLLAATLATLYVARRAYKYFQENPDKVKNIMKIQNKELVQ